ncbi:Na+/H+ antiporter NhaA [Megasphaera butyrica]|uniref:Na+/H+ antiporter NhaA n=1 Tax=Megasphaera butyrica TaxID=2981791 RepID=UPI000820EBCC|nr:Na+/H+ antiporter NhaA [Megasphaera butyrica]MCU6715203.1 Na+/H+ antiporter NhaA [Megasphaera butyrica]SCH98173.1 Sodium/proton antiporter nhaA [uncultured Megasphaera sp.]SCJ53843.1 Sodium/proton antiporter nhaA [uncultured Ruminococcus sp.]
MNKDIYERIQEQSRQMIMPFQRFFKQEASSGIVLLTFAVMAMGLANSPWAAAYEEILHWKVSVGMGDFQLSMSLLHWINDGLMAVFFFVIGMEIKREFLFGELKSPSSTLLPIAAAVGGMVVPALLYTAFNIGKPTISGWGVSMATDIAFSLGVLAFAAPRAPRAVVVFLTALAIVDDLGGILVIALFYSSDLHGPSLLAGAAVLLALFWLSRRNVQSVLLYLIGGGLLWYAFLQGGIHPTIAGVLLGFSIPAGTEETHGESLLRKLEHRLTPWSAFFVMPVFALSNAGIAIDGGSVGNLLTPVGLGIMAGLFLGKPLGIFLSVYGLIRLRVAALPAGVRTAHFLGAGMLGGIGFTMSLFIAALAFADGQALMTAKTAIVAASVMSGLAGTAMFKWLQRGTP